MVINNRLQEGILFRGDNAIQFHKYKNPLLFPFFWESAVTNGLGYQNPLYDVEAHIPHFGDTQEGLVKHLAAMDYSILDRKQAIAEAKKRELMLARIQFENSLVRYFNETQENYFDNLKRQASGKKLYEDKEKIEPTQIDEPNKGDSNFSTISPGLVVVGIVGILLLGDVLSKCSRKNEQITPPAMTQSVYTNQPDTNKILEGRLVE